MNPGFLLDYFRNPFTDFSSAFLRDFFRKSIREFLIDFFMNPFGFLLEFLSGFILSSFFFWDFFWDSFKASSSISQGHILKFFRRLLSGFLINYFFRRFLPKIRPWIFPRGILRHFSWYLSQDFFWDSFRFFSGNLWGMTLVIPSDIPDRIFPGVFAEIGFFSTQLSRDSCEDYEVIRSSLSHLCIVGRGDIEPRERVTLVHQFHGCNISQRIQGCKLS